MGRKATIGTIAGAVIGGVLGSVIPGAGTYAGAALGASLFGSIGSAEDTHDTAVAQTAKEDKAVAIEQQKQATDLSNQRDQVQKTDVNNSYSAQSLLQTQQSGGRPKYLGGNQDEQNFLGL